MFRTMFSTVTVGFLALAAHTHAAPAVTMFSRQLLGSNFGIPVDTTFDYVVVGGGTAGLTVAARLAEDPKNQVAVVEAGSFYEINNGNLSQIPADGVWFAGKAPNDTNPLIDWDFVTTPQAGFLNQSSHYARGKCLGGSSARNYMAYQRSTTGAQQQWADMVGDDAYQFKNFLPFYEKSLNFTPPDLKHRAANATPEYNAATLGDGKGPLQVTFAPYAQPFSSWAQIAMKEVGINPIKGFNDGQLIGSSYQTLNIDATLFQRASSETSFLQSSLGRSNFIVFDNTLATKVLFDSNKRAIGVAVDANGRKYTLSARQEVIVSAGTFQSPQMLMVSGVGPAATLNKHGIPVVANRPGVGQNMQDHILGGPSYRVDVTTTSSLSNPAFNLQAVEDYDQKHLGILTTTGADLLAWEKIPTSLRANFSQTAKQQLSKYPADWPEVEYLVTSAFFGYQQNFIAEAPTDGFQYTTMAVALITPLSRGTIDITSANMSDPPLINPNWLTDPTDQEVIVAGYRRAREIMETRAMNNITIGPEYFPGPALHVQTDAEILDFIRKSFNTVFHASSTCSMGKKSDPQAVVDANARVIGVQGLRVVDASAMPFLPPGHPTATIYALAEKIANDILTGN